MKMYNSLMILFILSSFTFAHSEIKNGYESEIRGARESLKKLYALQLEGGLTNYQNRKVKSRMEVLLNYISYYELTEKLLTQFQLISPDLYNKINNIRDIEGRTTDVYVKFIPQDDAKVMAAGITNVAQAKNDKHMYVSEYGERSISVKIWIFHQSLFALSHELGHIDYLVPNLARYITYYQKAYLDNRIVHYSLGHNVDDLSGRQAYLFEKKFHRDYTKHFRNRAERPKTPSGIVMDIRRKIQSELTVSAPVAAL